MKQRVVLGDEHARASRLWGRNKSLGSLGGSSRSYYLNYFRSVLSLKHDLPATDRQVYPKFSQPFRGRLDNVFAE